MNERLRILVLAANPINMPKLKLESEHRLLRNKMHDNAEAGNCELLVEWAARLTEIEQALKTYQPHIVHFAGHGNDDCICLENDEGASKPLDKEQFSELFKSASGYLRLVVLNACYSARQAEGLGELVDYIIGTTLPVADGAAVQFTAGFYQRLAVGDTVREAFHEALRTLSAKGEEDQADRYQLLVRPDADETKPLLPPFADNQVIFEVVREISAPEIEIANTVLDGISARSSSAEQRSNERNKVDVRAGSINAKKKLSIANRIHRTSN